jgi:hypothetical protein
MAGRGWWLVAVAWLVAAAPAQAEKGRGGKRARKQDTEARAQPTEAQEPSVEARGSAREQNQGTPALDEAPAAPEPPPAQEQTAEQTPPEQPADRGEPPPRKTTDPHEDPDEGYFFVGANWRSMFFPQGVLKWFLAKTPGVSTAGSFSGEFGYRRNGMQITAAVGWMKIGFHGPFQRKDQDPTNVEWLDTRWNVLMATGALTWSSPFTDWFALEYGLEAGAAFIFGNMIRTQAYQNSNGSWAKCASVGVPNTTYCIPTVPEKDTNHDGKVGSNDARPPVTNSATHDGAHYHVKAARGFAHGVPYGVPMIGPRLSLRFKPIHQLVIRADITLLLPMVLSPALAVQYGF